MWRTHNSVISLLLVIHLTSTVCSHLQNKYTTHSLFEICASTGGSPNLSLKSVGPEAAVILTLDRSIDNCELAVTAPERFMLAVACLSDSNNSCPLTLRGTKMKGERPNFCNLRYELPHLFPRRMLLNFKYKQNCDLRLMVTSVGAEPEVCSSKEQFPCNWKIERNVLEWNGLKPTLCVSRHLACDTMINCPLSAADETPTLCNKNQESAGAISHASTTRNEKVNLITQKIHEAAAKAAADLAKQAHNMTQQISSSEELLDLPMYVLWGMIVMVVCLLLAFFFIMSRKRDWLRSIFRQHGLTNNHSSASEQAAAVELVVHAEPIVPPPAYQLVPTCEDPPSYSSLFPNQNK